MAPFIFRKYISFLLKHFVIAASRDTAPIRAMSIHYYIEQEETRQIMLYREKGAEKRKISVRIISGYL